MCVIARICERVCVCVMYFHFTHITEAKEKDRGKYPAEETQLALDQSLGALSLLEELGAKSAKINGLEVPVLKNFETHSIVDSERQVKALADKAARCAAFCLRRAQD